MESGLELSLDEVVEVIRVKSEMCFFNAVDLARICCLDMAAMVMIRFKFGGISDRINKLNVWRQVVGFPRD